MGWDSIAVPATPADPIRDESDSELFQGEKSLGLGDLGNLL